MKGVAEFVVHGEPKGQPRPRAFARKMGNRYVARVYEEGTAEQWKTAIANAAQPHRFPTPLTGPVKMLLRVEFPRPKSHFRTGKHANELRPDAPFQHTRKPDADNVAKAVMDAITQISGFWIDDTQVAYLLVQKRYAEPGCAGRTRIQIAALEEQTNG